MVKLVNELNIELCIHGDLNTDRTFLVAANHISWLDALILANLAPFSFVAKEEVQQWPIIGSLSERFHVQYIKRQSKFSVYRSLHKLENALVQNKSVVFFPEGTTTTGNSTTHFLSHAV